MSTLPINILITGSNGFLGARVVEQLLAALPHVRLTCLVRSIAGETSIRGLLKEKVDRVSFVQGSLVDPKTSTAAVEQCDTIIHLASGVSGSYADLCQNSVVATEYLLNAIDARVASGVDMQLIHCSSLAVYETATLAPWSLVDENLPLEPRPELRDPYTFSKTLQDRLLAEWADRDQNKQRLTIVRPGVIYGAGGNALSNRIGLKIGPMFVKMGGKNPLPLVQVDNCAHAIAHLATHSDKPKGAFNLVDTPTISCADYLSEYQSEVEKLRCIPSPLWATNFAAKRIDTYSAKSKKQLPAFITPYRVASVWVPFYYSNKRLVDTGWQPPVSTTDGLAEHFAYFRLLKQGAA